MHVFLLSTLRKLRHVAEKIPFRWLSIRFPASTQQRKLTNQSVLAIRHRPPPLAHYGLVGSLALAHFHAHFSFGVGPAFGNLGKFLKVVLITYICEILFV